MQCFEIHKSINTCCTPGHPKYHSCAVSLQSDLKIVLTFMVNHGNGAHFENLKPQMHNYTSQESFMWSFITIGLKQLFDKPILKMSNPKCTFWSNKYVLTFVVCNRVEASQHVCLYKCITSLVSLKSLEAIISKSVTFRSRTSVSINFSVRNMHFL